MEVVVSQRRARVPVTVLTLKGESSVAMADRLETCAKEAIAAGARDLLIDLAETPYLGRSEIVAIDRIALQLMDQSRQAYDAMHAGIWAGTYTSPHVKLCKPTPEALQALRAAGTSLYLEIHDDMAQALASFGPNPSREQRARDDLHSSTPRRWFGILRLRRNQA